MRDNSATYTLVSDYGSQAFTPGGSVFFRRVDWTAGVRSSIRTRSRGHGARGRRPQFKEGGILSAEVWALNDGLSDAAIEAQRHALVGVVNGLMRESSGGSSWGTLSWTNRGGAAAMQLDRLSLSEDFQLTVSDAFNGLTGTLVLHNDKPYAEDVADTIVDSSELSVGGGGFVVPVTIPVTFVGSAGGLATVTNLGDFEAAPDLLVYGPITDPVITNGTTGEMLSFTGSIAAGEYWQISLFDRTVLLYGDEAQPVAALDVSASSWFGIPAQAGATCDLSLSGTGYDSNTKLRVQMRSAWG